MEVEGANIDFLGHSGFLITLGSNGGQKKIAIDPYNLSSEVNEKADIILITHSHYDHCSIKDIQKLSKEGSKIVIPADAQSKVTKVEKIDMQVIEAGDELEFGKIKIEALPAYNVGKPYHAKSEGWMGYVIKIGKVVIYHSGDSDKIPEMQKLSGYGKHGNNLICLLPVSGEYVMDSDEAFEVAKMIKPDVAIPMHYGAGVAGTIEDAERFVKLCEEGGINAKILEKK